MTQVDNAPNFMIWFVVGMSLILSPTLLALTSNSLSGSRFEKEHPNLAWLRPAYVYFSIVWTAFSIIFTARSLQTADSTTFFVFIIFIPLIGLGIVRGLIEIIFEVSLRLGIRIPKNRPTIGIGFIRRKYWWFVYYFFVGAAKVQLAGFLRLVVNIGLLIAMIYFLR